MSSDPRRLKRILNTMQSGIQSGISSMQTTMQRQGNSTFYTASIQQQRSQKCGWLKKQGGVVKSWHRRWFTIKGDHMYYFNTDDESKPPLGFIFLPGNKVTEHPFVINEPDKFIFEVIPGGDKSRMTNTHETYPLAATSDDERKDWVHVIRRVMYAEKGGAIFGQRLEETMRYEYQNSRRKIPQIVEMCVEFLNKHGIEMEGIFRLPGRTALIRQIREALDCGEKLDFEEMEIDINTVASLFKQYLRELPDPIIPTDIYESVMKSVIRDMPINVEEGLESLTTVLLAMPSHNYNLLQYLCRFLAEVHSKSYLNKMNDTNLATVFAQCMIRPEDDDPALLMGTAGNRAQVVLVLIQEVNSIFRIEYTAEGTSVMVDNLLDIGGGTTAFDAEAMSYYAMPKSLSLDSDLLDLDINAGESVDSLPEPIFPINQGPPVTVQESYVYQSETIVDSPYHTSSSSSRKSLDLQQADYGDDDSDDTADELPIFGSVRASLRHNHHNTNMHRSNSLESNLKASHNAQSNRSNSLDSRSVPIPPPRPSKRIPKSQSHDSIASDKSDMNNVDDDAIDSLLHTDLTDFHRGELLSFIETVFVELKSQRSKVNELHEQMAAAKEKHKQQSQSMAMKIDHERTATATAVDRVMTIQNQLQEYQMRYSQLMNQ